MKFNEAQKTALSHKTGPMMVLAGPGSGKTTVITHRIAGLLGAGVRPSEILVITFTKASARGAVLFPETGGQRKRYRKWKGDLWYLPLCFLQDP